MQELERPDEFEGADYDSEEAIDSEAGDEMFDQFTEKKIKKDKDKDPSIINDNIKDKIKESKKRKEEDVKEVENNIDEKTLKPKINKKRGTTLS